MTLFHPMIAVGEQPDLVTLLHLISACGHIGALDAGRWIDKYALSRGLKSDVMLCNALLDMYGKCGNVRDAEELFTSMTERTVVSWTTMIAGYALKGKSKEALFFFLFVFLLSSFLNLPRLSAGKDCPPVAKVLQYGIIPSLLLFLTKENDPELQVEAAKALRYLASGNHVTKVAIDQGVNLALDTLCHLVQSKDYDVARHTWCSLAVLTGCKNVKIRELIRDSIIFEPLLDFVRYPTTSLGAVGFRIFGNIVRGDKRLIDDIMTSRMAHHLIDCLEHEHVDVRKEVCWVFAYVTEGNRPWIKEVFDAGLIKRFVRLVQVDKYCVMEAAIMALSNVSLAATHQQIRMLVSEGWLDILCYLFCSDNQEIFKVCLDSLEKILEFGEAENENPYADHIGKIGGWDVLLDATCNYERKLHEKCLKLFRKYRPDILHVKGNYGYASDGQEEEEEEVWNVA